MQETQYIWLDGKLVDWNKSTCHVLTHTLHYGSGVYEGIRVYKTSRGPAIFRLTEHVERLLFSAQSIKLNHGYSKDELAKAIIETVAANKLEEGYIRPLIFNGYGEMGVGSKNPVSVMVACWPWPRYHESAVNGLNVKTSSYIRIHPRSTIVEAKICGHYTNGILALQELEGTHYHEALMLDVDGFVSECSSANVFMVKDNIIYTPQLGTILPGITRDFVIKLATDYGYQVIENMFKPEAIKTADEAFFTGTAVETTLIRSLDDTIIGIEGSNPVFQYIKAGFAAVVRGETERYHNYLTIVN
jgi:branched-chain amino acid aminotransferase